MILPSPVEERIVGVLSPSSDSDLESCFTASTEFTTSASSGSTIQGIGALSGKAILALGKVTLRGAESIIIRRRLGLIDSNLKFPPAKPTSMEETERMYDDLLELSRLGMYRRGIRGRAMQILLVQIGNRQIKHIIRCLKKWPDIEIQIFISEMMNVLDPIRLSHGKAGDELRVKAYRGALAAWESHSLVPFVDFCEQLAQALGGSNEAILRAGILDFLLHAYATNFRDPLAPNEGRNFHRTSTFQIACNMLLTSLCGVDGGLETICDHPLHALWHRRPELPFIPDDRNRTEQRVVALNSVPRVVVLWRLQSISDVLLDWVRVFEESVMHDFCIDLLELSGSESMGMEISIRALRTLHRMFKYQSQACKFAFRQYIASNTTQHCVEIMSQIVRHLSCIITPNSQESVFFYLPCDHEDFTMTAVPYFIHVFMQVTRYDEAFLIIILAADILGLMRPFLEKELRGKSVLQIARHDGDLLMVYDPLDFALFSLIREHGLHDLLPELSPQEKEKPAILYRRNMLCRAFNVFLSRENKHPFPIPREDDWDVSLSGLEGIDFPALWIRS